MSFRLRPQITHREQVRNVGDRAGWRSATLVIVVRVMRSNTILYSDRWVEMVAFYRENLGLAVEFENDWFVEFSVAPGAFVSVADAGRATVAPGHGAGVTLSLQVDDIHQVHSDLIRSGVEVGGVGRRWGADVLYLHDPSGNRVEFWAGREGGSGPSLSRE
jgi:catechol-2,3-dioxygenase